MRVIYKNKKPKTKVTFFQDGEKVKTCKITGKKFGYLDKDTYRKLCITGSKS
jgi:hypothetical protein